MVEEQGGWHVVNVQDARWAEHPVFGKRCIFEKEPFPQTGIGISVLEPGMPNCRYHRENAQEDFLVRSGECLLLVNGEEKRLKALDMVHCPPGVSHVFIGAGDGPCAILMIGARPAQRDFFNPRGTWPAATVRKPPSRHPTRASPMRTYQGGRRFQLRNGRSEQGRESGMKWGTRILLSIAALVVLWVVVVFSIIGSFDTTPNFNFDFLSMQWLRAKSAASNQVGAMARGSGFADTFDLARDRRAREHCEGFTAEQRVRDSICLSLDCPGQSDEHYQAAAGRNVMISMTPCLVRAAWGEPDDIRSITKAGDMSERWMYGDDDVLFKNGEVSILEDRP